MSGYRRQPAPSTHDHSKEWRHRAANAEDRAVSAERSEAEAIARAKRAEKAAGIVTTDWIAHRAWTNRRIQKRMPLWQGDTPAQCAARLRAAAAEANHPRMIRKAAA